MPQAYGEAVTLPVSNKKPSSLSEAKDAEHCVSGRPLEAYSTVVFLNTNVHAVIEPAVRRECRTEDTEFLKYVLC